MSISRRAFLCGCCIAPYALGQRRAVTIGGQRVRTIDMHSHVYVHDVLPLIRDHKEADPATLAAMASGPMALDAATLDARFREMDRQGVDVHVISVHPGQYHYWADEAASDQIVRIQNEKTAKTAARHPDRFEALGNVSLAHPALAASQMDHAVSQLNMRGFIIGCNVNGDELTNPKFEPFWKKAEQLGVVIFLHPAAAVTANSTRYAGAGYLVNTIGNPLETTIALSHMIFEGFLDRYPGLRLLAAHGGGFLPSYIGRSDNCNAVRDDCRRMQRKPSDYLRGSQLFFDALVYTPENIRHLAATVGANRIVMGSDFAFDVHSRRPVDAILETPGLSDAERIAILGGTAEALLKRRPA
jgi:aminocarboxymuconate-semialdehyde decarboxylase